MPASFGVGRPAGGARPFRVVPPLDHHGEPALNVALKRPPARTRGHQSHRSPVAHLATTHKKPPCNTWWREIKRTVQRPPLCLRRECRLRHSPTVVAGSSLDCRCTGTKGKYLMYAAKGGNEEAQTSPSPLRSSKGARGLCKVPGVYEGELSENV